MIVTFLLQFSKVSKQNAHFMLIELYKRMAEKRQKSDAQMKIETFSKLFLSTLKRMISIKKKSRGI